MNVIILSLHTCMETLLAYACTMGTGPVHPTAKASWGSSLVVLQDYLCVAVVNRFISLASEVSANIIATEKNLENKTKSRE